MEKKNLYLIYIMLKLMGLAVFKFDVKLEKLVVCRITTVYSVIIAITLGIFYPFAVIDFAFNFTKSIPSTVTPDIVAFLELAANFFVLILIYRFCIVKRRNLVAILNDFRILRIMFEEEFSTVNVNKSNTQIMIFLKTFVLAVILNICAILSTVMVSNIRYYMVFFLIAPYTTLTTVANMYFSIISIMVFYMKIINYKLKIINFRMKMCFRKTNNDCIYSDQIDKIAVFYHLIHTYTERITKVASGPILIYLLNRYLSVITMIFFQYFMIHNYFVKDIPYDLHISSSGCIYLMFCIVDVVIFICVCASLSFEVSSLFSQRFK